MGQGQTGHGGSLEVGFDMVRSGQIRLEHWIWDPGLDLEVHRRGRVSGRLAHLDPREDLAALDLAR